MVFSFLWQARPSMVVRFCSRGQLWNKSGKSTNNATKETTQRRPDGNGARSLKEKPRGRFSNERWVILLFFFGSKSLISLIPRSYAWNYGGFFLATFDMNAAIHMGLWLKKTRRGTCHQCNELHGPYFFWLPFPPWESPNTLLPCAKNDDSLHLPVFSITKKQNLRKPYHKPTTLPKMNIISTCQGFLSQKEMIVFQPLGPKIMCKNLSFQVRGSRFTLKSAIPSRFSEV